MGFLSQIRQAKRFLIAIVAIVAVSCQPQHKTIDVQGHRGCRGLMPENTIPAFLRAVDLGVTTLELDVVISADGQVVVSHEAYLNTDICLDPSGKRIAKDTVINLYQMPYAQIEQCDCGSLGNPQFPEQEKMKAAKPLLKDVIIAVKNRCSAQNVELPKFNVEIKSNAKHVFMYHPAISFFADEVVKVLDEQLKPEDYNLQCFDVLTLQYLHKTYPEITLAYLVEESGFVTADQVQSQLDNLGFTPDIYSCYYPMLTDEVVKWLHERDIKVIPWTVNETDDMLSLLVMNVDGIITDYPNRLRNLLKDDDSR